MSLLIFIFILAVVILTSILLISIFKIQENFEVDYDTTSDEFYPYPPLSKTKMKNRKTNRPVILKDKKQLLKEIEAINSTAFNN